MNEEYNKSILPKETALPDDYPVFWDYAYVCDGQVKLSPIKGTVKELKRDMGCKEVRRCDLVGRGLWSAD